MARPKTYSINETYFDQNIDERQLYLLGLILSDGSISKRGTLSYVCKSTDVEIIEFIRSTLGSSHPITWFRENVYGRRYSRYGFSNKRLIQSLVDKYSLPYNHSDNNLKIPSNIPSSLMHHFIRGIFDGDGSIWKSGSTYRCAITGGYSFLNELKSIIESELDVHLYFSYRYGESNLNSCQITLNGTHNVSLFKNYLYNGANHFLGRKHEKFNLCESQSTNLKTRLFKYNGREERITQLYIDGYSQRKIANILNAPYSSVRCCVQRLRRQSKII